MEDVCIPGLTDKECQPIMLLVSIKTVEVYDHIKIIPGKQCPQFVRKSKLKNV